MLSGIPGTGKSAYGQWLAQNHGFLHLDSDKGEQNGLAGWNVVATLPPGDPSLFISTLRDLRCPVILEMGYPPVCLPIVEALHRAGLTAWWFDGDRAAARRHFIKRNTVSVEALDIQMARIAEAWPVLAEFYGSRILHVVAEDGSFTAPATVFGNMFE